MFSALNCDQRALDPATLKIRKQQIEDMYLKELKFELIINNKDYYQLQFDTMNSSCQESKLQQILTRCLVQSLQLLQDQGAFTIDTNDGREIILQEFCFDSLSEYAQSSKFK